MSLAEFEMDDVRSKVAVFQMNYKAEERRPKADKSLEDARKGKKAPAPGPIINSSS